jgi:hypothetical protein
MMQSAIVVMYVGVALFIPRAKRHAKVCMGATLFSIGLTGIAHTCVNAHMCITVICDATLTQLTALHFTT